MAKKCGAAGENGALTSNYTPWAASVICHFLRWRCRSAQSREGLPLQQTCFKWDPRENSRQGNIAHACWFFFKAAITEEGKGSVSLLSPTQDSLPGLLLYFLLCNVGSSFSLFFSLKQLHLYRCCCSPSQDPAHEKQETIQCCFFSSPITATWTFLQATTAVLNRHKPSLGFLQKGRKQVWGLLNMNGKAKYFSISVKRINQTHTSAIHPLIILNIYLCSECCC